MYNDIIEGNNQICKDCWWATVQGNNPVAKVGNVYCSLYKQEYKENYVCKSWRHRSTRAGLSSPKFKFNLRGI
jgi:hypothetical protein